MIDVNVCKCPVFEVIFMSDHILESRFTALYTIDQTVPLRKRLNRRRLSKAEMIAPLKCEHL